MKTLKLIIAGIILLVSSSIQAQVSVSLNIGTAPSWGPSGYAQVSYYYLPDVQAYYDISASQFIYLENRNWVRSRYLPRQYRNYDLYNGYKVVLNDYHGNRPYTYFKNHRTKYNVGYRGSCQTTIGHRNDYYRYANNHKYDNRRRYETKHRYADNYRRSNDYRKQDNHNYYGKPNNNQNRRGHTENKGRGKH